MNVMMLWIYVSIMIPVITQRGHTYVTVKKLKLLQQMDFAVWVSNINLSLFFLL